MADYILIKDNLLVPVTNIIKASDSRFRLLGSVTVFKSNVVTRILNTFYKEFYWSDNEIV